ncbi:hypothetical protein DH2020_043118 [Rehmannia glutinosa]|uniref:Presenilin n=1 Tax=Rehmannia glutinosa TaxID=99300 RepID=A0ABR0UKN0_REHGL
MEENPRPRTILETCGEEIIRIVTPVSICMLSVVILVSILNGDSSSSGDLPISSMATIAYTENSSDSIWDKLKGALLNSLVFVAVVTAVTFLLVLLFYLGCTKFLKYYMGFSAFLVLGFMGGEISLLLIQSFSFPVDCITFAIVLFNFTVVGVLAVFMSKMALFVTQAYLVVIGVLVAYWFTLLPEWTTWVLLVAMALYDLAAVLLPGGPLRLLVELAMSREEDIPALVYEARPVINDSGPSGGAVQRRRDYVNAEEGRVNELAVPLIQHVNIRMSSTEDNVHVLVGRAAMYDYMTVYACYLAIIAGLGITLMLLAFYRKALPALPVSILLVAVMAPPKNKKWEMHCIAR